MFLFKYLVPYLKNNKLIFLFLDVTILWGHILKCVRSLTPLSPSSKFLLLNLLKS